MKTSSGTNVKGKWNLMWLVRIHRVPADRTILPAIEGIELRHVVSGEKKVVQLGVGADARRGRAFREGDKPDSRRALGIRTLKEMVVRDLPAL